MATNSEKVVVELELQLDRFNAAVKRGEINFDQNMVRIAQSARKTEDAINNALGNTEKPFLNAATRTRQLGIQIGQLGSSMASGGNAFTAIAQQASDFAYVLGGTQGAAGKLATFFSGPWGATLLAAGLTIAAFASKMDFAGDATEAALEKLKKHHAEVEASDRANALYANTLEGVEDAMRKTKDAMDKLNDSQKSQTRLTLEGALASLERTKNLQKEAEAALSTARAHLANQQAILTGVSSPAGREFASQNISSASQAITDAEAKLATIKADVGVTEKRITELTAKLVAERVSASADPIQKIHNHYDQLVAATATRLAGEGKVGAALEKQVAAETQILRLKEAQEVKDEQAKKNKQQGAQQVASFIMPVQGPVTSGFGARTAPLPGASSYHPAIDIGAPAGTPVHAAAGGVVITTGRMGGLGNVVIIDHGGGTISEYGHLSAIAAQRGQRVSQGDVIGNVGSTGISTGPHLDYRVRVGNRYVDPRKGSFPVDDLSAGTKAQQMAEQAARAADQAAAREGAYQRELAQLEGKILQQQRTKLLSADESLKLSEDQIIHDRDAANAGYAAALKAHQIDEAQAKQLTEKNNQLATARTMTLYADDGVRKAQLNAQLEEQRQQEVIAQARFEVDNAKTGEERRDAMLRQLDAETELTRLTLQRVIDTTAIGTVDHELAVLKLQQLSAEKSRRVYDINTNPNAMGPGQRYVQELTRTPAQLGEDLAATAVHGMQALNDQLQDAVLNFLGLGNASHTVLGSIVADLARIAIQQAIIRPLAEAIFGRSQSGGSGGVGGILGTLFSIGSLFGGHGLSGSVPTASVGGLTAGGLPYNRFFAKGGRPPVGQASVVGENGPELWVPDSAGTVIPNNQLMRGGMMGGSLTVHVVSDDDKFAAFIGQITDPRIARSAVASARGGSILARQGLVQRQLHQLG